MACTGLTERDICVSHGGSERPDQDCLPVPHLEGALPLIRRRRVPPDIRRQIVDAIIEGRYNGAEAARAFAVSEATVHRLVKAERLANPARNQVRPSSLGHERVTVKPDPRSRRALSDTQMQEVIERLYSGTDIGIDLAREFAVHPSTISRILHTAKAQNAFTSLATPDPLRRQKRVENGLARRAGRKSKVSEQHQEAILIEAITHGASFRSIALKYGVTPTTIARIVSARRIIVVPGKTQSLEEILSDVLEDWAPA